MDKNIDKAKEYFLQGLKNTILKIIRVQKSTLIYH